MQRLIECSLKNVEDTYYEIGILADETVNNYSIRSYGMRSGKYAPYPADVYADVPAIVLTRILGRFHYIASLVPGCDIIFHRTLASSDKSVSRDADVMMLKGMICGSLDDDRNTLQLVCESAWRMYAMMLMAGNPNSVTGCSDSIFITKLQCRFARQGL